MSPIAIPIAAVLIHAAWLALEWRRGAIAAVSLDRRRRPLDRHSSTLWDIANAMEWLGLVLGFLGFGRFTDHVLASGFVGLGLLLAGIWIRWTAIRTLGHLFTGFVTISDDHRLVQSGIYGVLRHPSYSGLLVAHVGLGLSFASWVSVAMSTIPFAAATAYRIRVEEAVLREAFEDEYADYARSTWRLLPWVY
jgi:protein-S-isoprenylcysteine O-methyltransferase